MLLFIYPSEFRLRFGSEMVATFSDLICGEWEHDGLPGVARVWWAALGEMFSVAVLLQLQNSIAISISLSFLCSSALFITILLAMTHACGSK
jgi:hypothetical protein